MLDFLYRNAALVAIVLISGAMLLWPMLTRKKRGKEVDSTIATELINHKDAQVIDIRSSDDYKAGHIARSRNFPATVIHHHLNEFDKTKPVLLISRRRQNGCLPAERHGLCQRDGAERRHEGMA